MIYLDNAATTIKKPDAVYDAVLDAMKHCGNSDVYKRQALKGDNTTADELEAAKEFIAYLQTDEAMSVFEKYHFTVNE